MDQSKLKPLEQKLKKVTVDECVKCRSVDTLHKSGVCKSCRTSICKCGKKYTWNAYETDLCGKCLKHVKKLRELDFCTT